MKIKMIGNVYLWICLNLLLLLVPHLTWVQACQFTSPASTNFVIGQENRFQVTVDPPSAFIELRGDLPKGVTFDSTTGVLSGTPVEGSDSIYPLTFISFSDFDCVQCMSNCASASIVCELKCRDSPDSARSDCTHKCEQQKDFCEHRCECTCTQQFTLHILSAPCGFTSSNTTTFALEQENTFEITVADSYSGSITYEGDLPAGVFFHDNEDGTATLSGTPAFATTGCYPLTLHFFGSIPDQPDSTCESSQSFLLIVGDANCSPAAPKDFTVMQKEVSSEDRLARAKRNKIKFDNILRWRAPRHRAGIAPGKNRRCAGIESGRHRRA